MSRNDPGSGYLGEAFPWVRDMVLQLVDTVRDLQQAEADMRSGDVFLLDPDDPDNAGVVALVEANGLIGINRRSVDKPLQDYLADPDAVLDNPNLAKRVRYAIESICHEAGHLTGPSGWRVGQKKREFGDVRLMPIEESVTEAWALKHAPEVIAAVLPPEHAAAVLATKPALASYQGWVEGLRTFTEQTEAATGVPAADLIQAAVGQHGSYKAHAMATLIFDRTLSDVIPDHLREESIQRLRGPIDAGFASMASSRSDQNGKWSSELKRGRQAGSKAATQLATMRDRLVAAYGPAGTPARYRNLRRAPYVATGFGAARHPERPPRYVAGEENHVGQAQDPLSKTLGTVHQLVHSGVSAAAGAVRSHVAGVAGVAGAVAGSRRGDSRAARDNRPDREA